MIPAEGSCPWADAVIRASIEKNTSSQVIPAQAVEAAAKASFEARGGIDWDSRSEHLRSTEIGFTRLALEAAAPHMLAGAWDEGGRAAIEREHAYGVEEKALFSNPYGSKS